MDASDLDEYLERTVRFDGVSLLPEACSDDDGRTVTVPPPEMAILAAKTALATSRRAAYSGYPTSLASPRAIRSSQDDAEMRNAVIGIWMVAAFLFATLGILVK